MQPRRRRVREERGVKTPYLSQYRSIANHSTNLHDSALTNPRRPYHCPTLDHDIALQHALGLALSLSLALGPVVTFARARAFTTSLAPNNGTLPYNASLADAHRAPPSHQARQRVHDGGGSHGHAVWALQLGVGGHGAARRQRRWRLGRPCG
jgi:hypothetical protein